MKILILERAYMFHSADPMNPKTKFGPLAREDTGALVHHPLCQALEPGARLIWRQCQIHACLSVECNNSDFGRELNKEGMREFLNIKTVNIA